MDEINSSNLQNFCRVCLNNLTIVKSEEKLDSYPHLKQFINILINDLISDQQTMYPKKLCSFCFKNLEKLESKFQQFRFLVTSSTNRIEDILKSVEKCKFEDNLSDDDDNKLLLPELAQWNGPMGNLTEIEESKTEVKTEPIEATETCGLVEKEIKSEIEYEFDEGSSSCDPYSMNDIFTISEEQSYQNYAGEFKKRDRNKKSFKCPSCNKHAYKKVYLDAHIRKIHEGHDKPFLCSVSECQKAFTRYNQLHVHIQMNHTIQAIKFTCDFEGCNESFRLGQTLETHRRVVHNFKDNLAPLELNASNQESLKSNWMVIENICQECGKTFHSKKALSEHLRRHANDKRYVCEICNVSKVTKTELITHKRVHDRSLQKFKCTLCPQEFNHKNAISRHVRVVHEGQRRFGCRFCPRRFGTKNSQMCHERLHTGEKPFKCEICLKGFTQVEGLKSHMKNHDKNLRKHVCKFCSSRFITKKNLLDHEQRHLGSKPHICRICSRGFPRPEDLSHHFKFQHGINDEFINEDDTKNASFAGSSDDSEQANIFKQRDSLENSNDISNDYFESGENDPLS